MQIYTYSAKDKNQQLVKADVEAASVSEAAKLLTSKELFPLSIVEKGKGPLGGLSNISLSHIGTKDKVLFTRQLATLVKAGLPLAQALRILRGQISNKKLLALTNHVSTDVEGGMQLSQALSAYPKVFGTIYLSMVQAGEVSGTLDDTLLRLAAQEEKTAAINSKIRSAFTYPIVVLVVLIAVMILMITLVLPQVGGMYKDLKQPLPPLTQLLLGFSQAFSKFWYLFLLGLAGLVYAARVWILSPNGRQAVDKAKISVPVISTLVLKLYMSRMTRTLGSLVATGVPVLQALDITSKSMNNSILEKAIKDVAEKVRAGIAMSQPISENPVFLPMVGQMIAVGEQTGTLGDSLNKIAGYYEDEVDEAVTNISTLIEPMTMVVLGGMVAFLIAAVLLPIYGLVTKIH